MLNRAAADAERLMIVRNIMRARDRSSMVFTRIPQLRGSMTRSISNSVGLSFAEGSNNEGATAGVTMGGESNPSFDVQVMNDEKFNRAVYSSIDLGVYELLQEYGWPRNLLHTLFIERVEVGSQIYDNDPEDWGAFSAFNAWLNERELRVCHADNPVRFGPAIRVAPEPSLEGFAALAEQKLSLRDAGGGQWQVQRARVDRFFAEGDCEAAGRRYTALSGQFESSALSGGQAAGNVQVNGAVERAQEAAPLPRPGVRTPSPPAQSTQPAPAGRIVIRSVQGALYYLGEVVRAKHESGNLVQVTVRAPAGIVRSSGSTAPSSRTFPIFVVQEGVCPRGLTFVHDDGRSYSVPPRGARVGVHCESRNANNVPVYETLMDPGTTQQVIALMLQLVGIIQSGDERPATEAVQVVN